MSFFGQYEEERHSVVRVKDQVEYFKDLMSNAWMADVSKFVEERTVAFKSRLGIPQRKLDALEASRLHNERSTFMGVIVQFLRCYYDAVVLPCASCLKTPDKSCPHVSAEELRLFWKLGSTCITAYEAVLEFLVDKKAVLTARNPLDSSGMTSDCHPGKMHPQIYMPMIRLKVSKFLFNIAKGRAGVSTSPSDEHMGIARPHPSIPRYRLLNGVVKEDLVVPSSFRALDDIVPEDQFLDDLETIDSCRCSVTKWLFFLASMASASDLLIQFPPPTDSYALELYGIVLVPEDQRDMLTEVFKSAILDGEEEEEEEEGEKEKDVDEEEEEEEEEEEDSSYSTPKKYKRKRARRRGPLF